MEISVGIYAVIFIFFFLIIPGFICRRFYYHGEFSKQLNLSANGLVTLLSALFIGITLTLSFIALHNLLATKPINLDGVLNSFDSNFVSEQTEIVKQVNSHNKFEGLTNAIYSGYLKYLGAFYVFSAITGFFTSKLVLYISLDTRIKFLRYRNEWHYLFSGKILKFKKLRASNNHQQQLKVKYTYVDILVAEKGDETTLYSGLLGDYEINPSDPCKLEKIHLFKASRYKKSDSTVTQKNIPGNLFTILGEKILNINCTYICYDEEEENAKKYNRAKTILFIIQLISTLSFLLVLTSFIFSISLLNYEWYKSVLHQSFLTKTLLLLSFNFAIGFLTPFENAHKEKRVKFIGWGAIIAKVLLVSLFILWIYGIYR